MGHILFRKMSNTNLVQHTSETLWRCIFCSNSTRLPYQLRNQTTMPPNAKLTKIINSIIVADSLGSESPIGWYFMVISSLYLTAQSTRTLVPRARYLVYVRYLYQWWRMAQTAHGRIVDTNQSLLDCHHPIQSQSRRYFASAASPASQMGVCRRNIYFCSGCTQSQ